jgi:uncharacterized protein
MDFETFEKNKTGYEEYYSIVKDIMENETVQQMKLYRQHYDTNTYEHCFHVSYLNYKICKALHLDYKSAARAGMIHDLFLYDWRRSRKELNLEGYHAFIHPKIAYKNASAIFDLNKKEKDIILKHMWPLTFFHFPKYPESFIITISDKYSALYESFSYYKKKLTKKDSSKKIEIKEIKETDEIKQN